MAKGSPEKEFWIAKIRRSAKWDNRDWFTAYELATHIGCMDDNGRPDRNMVGYYLRDMNAAGHLHRRELIVAGKPVVQWQRKGINWLAVPWRKTYPPVIYGAPEWNLYR